MMAWAKVDDGWWCHPKVLGLPLASRGLWVSALSWSCAQRLDVVPTGFLGMVGGSNSEANDLVAAGLWVAVDGGWCIHDWAEYQDRSLSEKRSDAGRKGGLASGRARRSEEPNEATGRSKDEANAEAGTHPFPSHPVPTEGQPTPPAEPEPGTELALIGDDLPPATPPSTYTAEFEAWWTEYPRKVEKAPAAKAYTAARRVTSAEHLLEAVRTHAAAWAAAGVEQQFIVYPERWLKRKRYDEEPDTARRTPQEPKSRNARNRANIETSLARAERRQP